MFFNVKERHEEKRIIFVRELEAFIEERVLNEIIVI